ncbi:hypothetical protein BDF14DRAFT_1834038 [Spinellus fusiger]|nr:hypothetical protein BDF14DRAFT_1834038 [Spinellus fusiger]
MAVDDSIVIFVESGLWHSQTTHQSAFASASATLVAGAVTSPVERGTLKPLKQPKKKTAEKDTLSRRSNLTIGKEGSRRRQRWDNNNFSDHPTAVLCTEDLRPPGYERRSRAPQWCLPALDQTEAEAEAEAVVVVSHSRTAPLSRHTRRDLKRSHLPMGIVSTYEEQILHFIQQQKLLPTGWREAHELCLVWEISDRFVRWFVHAMCDYYGLASFSKCLSIAVTNKVYR